MFSINGLPDDTTMVTFRNYPPGTATFIYFVIKIIGYSESRALMAQGFLLVANLPVLLVFCKWKNPIYTIASMISSVSLLWIIGGNIYNLPVDTILGLVALSIAIICYYYKDDWRSMVLVTTPILIMLLLIKDSGKLFLFFNIVLIILFIYQSYFKGKKVQGKQLKILAYVLISVLLIPLTFNFLWGKYTEKAYPNNSYESNKFAITADKVTEIAKSEEFKENLGPNLIEAATNPDSNNFKCILLLNGLSFFLLLLMYLRERQLSKLLLSTTLFVNAVYICYILSLYFMYLFLMPEKEAVRLASFERYQSTMVIYFAGMLMTVILYELSKSHFLTKLNWVRVGVVAAVLIVFCYPFHRNIHSIINKPDYHSSQLNSVRYAMKIENEKIAKAGDESPMVLYYVPEGINDSGYLTYVSVYEQLSSNFRIISSLSSDKERGAFINLIKNSDYLVVIEADQQINDYFSKNLYLNISTGVYKILNAEEKLLVRPLEEL
jgi:hypothetical protein